MEEQNTMNKILLEEVVTNIRNTIKEYIYKDNPTDIGKIDNACMMVVGQKGTYTLYGIRVVVLPNDEEINNKYYFDVTEMMNNFPETATTYTEPAPYGMCINGSIKSSSEIFVTRTQKAEWLLDTMKKSAVSYKDIQISKYGVAINKYHD